MSSEIEEFFSLTWSSINQQCQLFGFSLCFCYFLSLSIFVAFDQLRLYCWGDSSVALFAFMILNYVLRYIIIIITVYKVTFLLLSGKISEYFLYIGKKGKYFNNNVFQDELISHSLSECLYIFYFQRRIFDQTACSIWNLSTIIRAVVSLDIFCL